MEKIRLFLATLLISCLLLCLGFLFPGQLPADSGIICENNCGVSMLNPEQGNPPASQTRTTTFFVDIGNTNDVCDERVVVHPVLNVEQDLLQFSFGHRVPCHPTAHILRFGSCRTFWRDDLQQRGVLCQYTVTRTPPCISGYSRDAKILGL